jgi:hypothetical protein
MRALARVAGAVLVVAVTLPLAAPAASAQGTTTNPPAAGAPVGMHLVSQDTWIGLHKQFTMLLHIDDAQLEANPNAAIAVSVYASATSRTAFDRVIAGQGLGGILDTNRIPLSSLPRFGGNVAVSFGLPGSNVQPSLAISRPGVYPVQVSLVDTGSATGSFVTWLVVVDTSTPHPVDEPLMVSAILPLTAPPATLPDGTPDPGVVSQMKPGGRLDRIATLLARATKGKAVPLSLVLSPETLETWSSFAGKTPSLEAGFARVRAAARNSSADVLPAPYVPIDATALVAAGLGDHLSDEFVKGGKVLDQTLGVSPFDHPQTAFVEPADDAAVDQMRQMLVTRVAVRDSSLIPTTHQFTPAQGFVLDTAGGRSQGVATAPFVEQLLNGPDPSALKAERVVAALAEIAYEEPGIPRGIVIAPDDNWTPDLSAMSTLIDTLRDLPIVQPVTIDTLMSQISTEKAPSGAPVERRLQNSAPPATPIGIDQYAIAAEQLHAFEGVVGVDDSIAQQGEQALSIALSTSISPERAQAELNQVTSVVSSFSDAVTVVAKRITLTARKASVPLTFVNHLKPARPISVRVHFDSSKLRFPAGADQTITLPPGTTTHRFDVEARTSGTFPMTISLTSTDGQLAFGSPVRVTVRSAVFGGLAIGITIAALVVLALWWGNHFRRTRRARRMPVPAVT